MKNNKEISNIIKKNYHNSIISVFVIVTMIFMSLLCIFSCNVFAEGIMTPDLTDGNGIDHYNINNSEDFINYALEYASGEHKANDYLNITISTGQVIRLVNNNFEGLGTSSRPFKGTIYIHTNNEDKFLSNAPIFNYISTDAQIIDQNGDVRNLTIMRNDNVSDKPLFANYVVASDNTENPSVGEWSVKLAQVPSEITGIGSATSYPVSGVIGTIKEGAIVDLTFEHDSLGVISGTTATPANFIGSGNIGIACNTLKEGAQLTVNISSNYEFNVVSTGGHAGGIVGEMEAESKLILGDDFTSVANVSTEGEDTYAGAIVGYAVDAEIDYNGHTITASKTISGVAGAGGLFGYYKSTINNGENSEAGNRVFNLSSFLSDTNLVIEGQGSTGGIFGYLEATNSIIIKAGETFSANDTAVEKSTFDRYVQLNGGDSCGGVIGSYKNTSLANTLEIKNIRVCASTNQTVSESKQIAGVIGKLDTDSVEGNYISIHDVAVKNNGNSNFSSALIGDMNDEGSFLDISGKIAVTNANSDGKFNAGLVWYQREGVIRLSGYTDFGGGYFGTVAKISAQNSTNGQLVGKRGNGLVYSLGTGSDTLDNNEVSSGWTYRRANVEADDIGDWGEVFRPESESTYFNVSNSLHTVEIKAPKTTMSSKIDFILTALNIQHNKGDKGALLFEDDVNDSEELLISDLTIDAALTEPINLANTGITGLTRDNGQNNPYEGTFDGNGKTIKLAIGQAYGLSNTGTSVTNGNNNFGTIIRHQYQGLFAKADGATFENIIIDGYDYTKLKDGGNIGGVVALGINDLTLNNVTLNQTDYVYSSAGVSCGGAIGKIDGSSTGTMTIKDVDFSAKLYDDRTTDKGEKYFGGVIGRVDAIDTLTIDVSGTTLNGLYSKTNDKAGNIYFGGLIGTFASATTNANNNKRTVNIASLTIGESMTITSQDKTAAGSRSSGVGSFVGGSWPNVNVVIGTEGSNVGGITVGGTSEETKPTISILTGSTNGNLGVLFYKVTGHMKVYRVNIIEANIKSELASSTLGFIVNDGCYLSDSALYLDVEKSGYTINQENTSISEGKFLVFDEIIAYSVFKDTNILDNGQAIVSINLPDDEAINMTSRKCNTYQNQTSYATKVNEYTRYYYNLDSIRQEQNPSPAKKLLIWSVNTYAHSTVKDCFSNGFTTELSGNCDMNGLSYYPVDASGMTISGMTVKFYNSQIETQENNENTDGDSSNRSTRSTVSKTQHRLMHEGIFKNYSGTLIVNGLTIQGNVSNKNKNRSGNVLSGFLICDTLTNDQIREINLNNITLSDANISGRSAKEYSPLLINRTSSNNTININTVRTTDYPAVTQAISSSLIGNVGNSTASNIRLTFSDIKLDARDTVTDSTLNGVLTGAYGTSRSIFDKATLLESFTYFGNSSGTYNYNHNEDYGNPSKNVTYGKEISSSSEFAGLEKNYYDYFGASDHYTHPNNSNATSAYSFSKFLPYVATAYNITNKTHEIKVNVQEMNIENGCGQYNDPYIITDGGQFVTIAKIISGNPNEGVSIVLPDNLGGYDDNSDNNKMWHDSNEHHHLYVYDGTDSSDKKFVYTFEDNTKTLTLEDVRIYLAGAYYLVRQKGENIVTIPSTYEGLGTSGQDNDKFNCPYAFRGVIVGETISSNVYPTIVNNSSAPLIKISNGSVVKNVNIKLNNSFTLQRNSEDLTFNYSNNTMPSYGLVIGQVMAGDNIIDNVGVSFGTYVVINITLGSNFKYGRAIPVGGYIGVIVNGGVIFRNMSGKSGLLNDNVKNGNTPLLENEEWLYVNPIIGRVIAGYAFEEGNTYYYESPNISNSYRTTNGIKEYKNYGICTLVPEVPGSTIPKLNVYMDYDGATKHVVTIPDAQALYILSCIVNSGAASAAYNKTTEQDYANLTGEPWIGYREYAETRCGEYSAVATDLSHNANECSDYNKINGKDTFAGRTKIPYIVRQYTESTGGDAYYVRSLTHSSSLVYKMLLGTNFYKSNGESDLEKGKVSVGYRGIGTFFSTNDNLKFGLAEFDGQNQTVELHMTYWQYSPYGSKYIENYSAAGYAGFGLITRFYNNVAGDTLNGTQVNLHDLNICGKIYYNVRTSSGTIMEYKWNSGLDEDSIYGKENTDKAPNHPSSLTCDKILSVGGLVGMVDCPFKMVNIFIDGIHVEGVRYTGGLIGHARDENYNRSVQTLIKNCGTNDDNGIGITVIGGATTGGLVGYANSVWLVIQGNSSNTNLTINKIQIKGPGNIFDGKNVENFAGAGGLIGHADCGRRKGGTNEEPYNFDVKNYNVVSSDPLLSYIGMDSLYDYDDESKRQLFAGGLCGTIINSEAMIENTNVSIKISSVIAGGFIGKVYQGRSESNRDIFVRIKNITFENCSITGFKYAGGVVGLLERENNTNPTRFVGLDIDTCELIGLTITQTKNTQETESVVAKSCAAAACVAATNAKSGILSLNIKNILVKNCNVNSHYATKTTQNADFAYNGTGAIIGFQEQGDNSKYCKIFGYNILLTDLEINHYTTVVDNNTNDIAYITGNNRGDTNLYELVGLSISKCNNTPNVSVPLARLTGNSGNSSGENYGSKTINNKTVNGYIILADYKGVSALNNHNENNSYLNSIDDMSATSPYVTINPANYVVNDEALLTSDGIVSDLENMIVCGANGVLSSVYYNYSLSYEPNGWGESYSTILQRNIGDLQTHDGEGTPNGGKFSTYNAEQAVSITNDFVVLTIDDTNRVTVTKLINSYLNILANTRFNYTVDQSNIYKVVIKRIETTNGNFIISNEDSNLIRNNEQFYIDANNVDTTGAMFTLIDIQYFNPLNTNQIAYHLYVPILVKKMLRFDFHVALGSGTNYDHTWYTDRYGQPLLENLGSPVTVYFGYDYKRTYAEWKTALENGENLLYNFSKILNFDKTTGSIHLDAHDGNTEDNRPIMVLVDLSKGGKAYYSRFNSSTIGSLTLSSFREELGNDSSTAFTPSGFCELMNIHATANDSGKFIVTTNPNNATVKVDGVYYKLWEGEQVDEQKGIVRVDLEIVVPLGSTVNDIMPISEYYYLSIFTNESDSTGLSVYKILAPQSFNDPTLPTRIENPSVFDDNGHGISYLYMGNVIEQTGLSVATTNEDLEINSSNNYISFNLQSSMKIVEESYDAISGLFGNNSNINVYQSFMVALNIYTGTSTQKLIVNPDINAKYQITGLINSNLLAYDASDILITSNYIELISPIMNEYISPSKGATANINATATLVYDGDEKIAQQFPKRANNTNDGTQVSVKSNVGYDKSTLAISTASIGEAVDSENRRYYSEFEVNKAILRYKVQEDVYGGDYGLLGINPLDSNDLTEIFVTTIADLDITEVFDATTDYDRVRCVVSLSEKSNYANKLYLSNYLTNMVIPGAQTNLISSSTPANSTTYTFTLDKSWCETADGMHIRVPIDFKVLTGTPFESRTQDNWPYNYYYSNYKVTVEMYLCDENENVCEASRAEDFIIYTNARIIPDFIDYNN